MTHVICLHVENQQGVLARISGLFSGRGYNLESITAGVTTDPTVTRITLACTGDDAVVEQIKKQLNRLIDVIKVTDLTDEEHIGREMVFVRVNAEPANRGEILRINEIFRGRIVDVTPTSYTIEITGEVKKVAAFLELLQPFGIQEIVRSGTLAIARGSKSLPKREEGRLRVAGRKSVATD